MIGVCAREKFMNGGLLKKVIDGRLLWELIIFFEMKI